MFRSPRISCSTHLAACRPSRKSALLYASLAFALCFAATPARSFAQTPPIPHRQMEKLGRGLVAVRGEEKKVFVSWRMLNEDADDVAFNLYRSTDKASAKKLNSKPISNCTNFTDETADFGKSNSYFVRSIVAGKESEPSRSFTVAADAPVRQYISIPLRTPEGYSPNDASVGDLDGDGEYEIVLHQVGKGRDNSQRGATTEPILEAYKLSGEFLWRINLGKNIREGAHYTQFIVMDLDGDGRAEIVCKTADGSIDGDGKVIGDPKADWRNDGGYVLKGPEFLTVFDGATGKALATTDYWPPRGNVADWGDSRGNRVDRFLACAAYLDGKLPSVVMCRGYYTRLTMAAWNWRDGKLSSVWKFDSDDPSGKNKAYRGQGNHNLSVGDVDGDGKDEIVYGSCCVDHDGKGLYSTGLGHGDAMHLSDIDPERPGLEVFCIHEHMENQLHPHGAELHDAKTGKILWSKESPDVGRGISMDVDPRYPGYECWASGEGLNGLWNAKGELISKRKPRSCDFGVWWDGDLLREQLDRTTISKWDWKNERDVDLLRAEGCYSNNSTKATPCLCADIFGDWREEVIWRSRDNKELRIYTTTIPTTHKLRTLMHDPQYRLSVTWQNVGYNQPTQPGFYLGEPVKKSDKAP